MVSILIMPSPTWRYSVWHKTTPLHGYIVNFTGLKMPDKITWIAAIKCRCVRTYLGNTQGFIFMKSQSHGNQSKIMQEFSPWCYRRYELALSLGENSPIQNHKLLFCWNITNEPHKLLYPYFCLVNFDKLHDTCKVGIWNWEELIISIFYSANGSY